MNKRTLMLSAATAVILSSPALAAAPVDSVATSAQKTSTLPNPLTIQSAGGIKLTSGTAPLLTIDSNAAVTNGGTFTFTGTTSAVGLLIDGTKTTTGSFTNSGTIDLTGTGTNKIGLHLSGAGSYTGGVTFDSASIVRIAGDQSTGILQDSGFVLNGDLSLGGNFTMTPTTANGTTASSVALASLLGTINGNVIVNSGAIYTAIGDGATGISISGHLMACTTSGCPATSIGTFANSGSIVAAGVATRSTTGANAESGSAVVIGNSIDGGFLNNGSDGVTGVANAVISANGVLAPTLLISPSIQATTGIVIKPDTADTNAGTFGFINRGSITAAAEDNNQNTRDVVISGASSQTVNINGGIFNSGIMTAQATSVTSGNAVSATALQIDSYVSIPNIEVSGESNSGTNGNGRIAASVTGTQGGTATAILIDGAPVSGTAVTLVNKITVDTGGSIFATATVTDPASSVVTQLVAIGIEDRSNSLANINNFGTISAQTTILTNGHTAIAHAVDVSLNTIGLDFENKGTVIGDVLFGTGDSSYVLTGSGSGIGQVASHTGAINFAGGNDNLTLNSFANVAGAITSQGTLTVSVADHATLAVQNVVTGSGTNLLVKDFTTTGGNLSTVDLSVTSGLATRALIEATGTIAFSPGTNLGITYGSFIPAGGTFMLLSAPTGNLSITPGDLANYNQAIGGATTIPFLFNSASLAINPIGGNDVLELTVVPKTQTQLGLSGYAVQMFPLANVAISSDDALGAALVAGINSQADAQKVYSAFAPDVSGGTRAVAISITDQATGVVSARQRQLRLFSKEPGELTLWGNEFGEYLSTHGQTKRGVDGVTLPTGTCTTSCPSVTLNGFKDHGFGFSLGLDSGAPEDGWYGAAFTFYTGDVQAGSGTTKPTSKTGELWYLLTGYTDWRGRGLFVDSQVSVGYGQLKGKRFLDLTVPVAGTTNTTTFSREADSNRAALVGTLGLTTGVLMKFGSTFFTPQLSIDGLTMREEGYTEINGGSGFDLAVKPYYANSLRAFLGTEVRQDINLGDFFLQPSARVGYRFDFLNDATKLRAQFSDSNTATLGTNPGTPFTIRGPDPSRGNIVGGLNLNATTDNWTIGLSYDFVRGSNNATEQTGTLSLLGRI
ncbi:MAG: autotransporter outer membrane beta-barrel domain-containing protein [Rhizomicrobium sp.]